ncbi:MAG: S1 family peptidase [Pyrinomonadaceae bacterium]
MNSRMLSTALVLALFIVIAPDCSGQDFEQVFKQQERYTLPLELQFTRKNQKPLQRAVSFLLDSGPNGFATGFIVGDGLVMTAYHVVSGELSDSKKVVLGFSRNDALDVKVWVRGREATVIRIDKDADLALLAVEGLRKQTRIPSFKTLPENNEKLFLIARPHGDHIVTSGVFHGSYALRGLQYLSVKIESRDGFSGSPVYNQKAELVGIFSGYDWSQKVALISPGERAQKLLEDHNAEPKTVK